MLLGTLELLSRAEGNIYQDRMGTHETALILASRHGFVQLVDSLLERGARVDATDRFGNTALMAAKQSTRMPSEEARVATITSLTQVQLVQQARLKNGGSELEEAARSR